jgi:bacillithiol biosynthesis cysteine-adding enzyme BshC
MTAGSLPQIITEPLGGSPLAQLVAAGEAAEWIAPAPRNAAEWRDRVRQLRETTDVRAQLGALAPALDASGAAAERLARVVAEGGIVVTTGQQSGLFGGPVYTWSKALSALALADEIQRVCDIPVAPVFWAATDDADLAEASVTAVSVPGGAERLVVQPHPDTRIGAPMSLTPLGDVTRELRRLAEAAGSSALSRPIAAAQTSYRPGATVGGAFVTLLRDLLQPLGIAVLDAGHTAVREAMSETTGRALREAAPIAKALAARTAELRAAGHKPRVADIDELSLVFEWADGIKVRIPVTRARAALEIPANRRSPNVLLRPVAERLILPTAAYVAGPGELAYFAQVGAVAAALDAPSPVVVPRWSCTIVEPKVQRLLDKYDFTPAALEDPHAAERRHASRAMPTEARNAVEAARAQVADLDAMLRALARTDPSLISEQVAEGHTRRAAWLVGRLERRIRAAVKRSEDDAMRAIATARGALSPFGQRQERTLNFLPFYARHGEPLLDEMRKAANEHARRLIGA